MFEPLAHAPAYQLLAQQIRDRILSRQLRDGEALPTETDLARQFAVNRSTVREALRDLQSSGLVTRRQGSKRLVVCRPSVAAVGGGVSEAMRLHGARFADVWEALSAVQPAIAAAAARNRSPAGLAGMAAAAEGFAVAGLPAVAATAQVAAFFRALGQASANPVFMMMNEPLMRLLEPSLAIMIDQVPQARDRIAGAQRHLLNAVLKGDEPDATAWMARHIRDFGRGYELAGIPLATEIAAPMDG